PPAVNPRRGALFHVEQFRGPRGFRRPSRGCVRLPYPGCRIFRRKVKSLWRFFNRGGTVMKRRFARLAALAAVFAMLALAACGGDGGGTQESTGGAYQQPAASEPETETPAAGEHLTIGIVLPATGDLGFLGGPMINAALLAIDVVNEAGGV